MAIKQKNKSIDRAQLNNFPGYPIYPPSEDVYNNLKEEIELDPEEPTKQKVQGEHLDGSGETGYESIFYGNELDVSDSE